MKITIAFAAAFVLWSLAFAADARTSSVGLVVRQNGRRVPAPAAITLTANGESERIPVTNGRFEFPSMFSAARQITLSARMNGELVRFTIGRKQYLDSSWTILLADKNFGEDYDWAVPKGTYIPKSCILLFQPPNGDGTFSVVRNCRSRKKLKN